MSFCVYKYTRARRRARSNIHLQHHHVEPPARISLAFSSNPTLQSIGLGICSRFHTISAQDCCIKVLAGRPAFVRQCKGVHKSMSLMSSSPLLQQCPQFQVCQTWIVFVMGGKWPYSWCFVGWCLQDLFNIACRILV